MAQNTRFESASVDNQPLLSGVSFSTKIRPSEGLQLIHSGRHKTLV